MRNTLLFGAMFGCVFLSPFLLTGCPDPTDNEGTVGPSETSVPSDPPNLLTPSPSGVSNCDEDGDGVSCEVDCDDHDPTSSAASIYYLDIDHDGYGAQSVTACHPPENAVTLEGDCDDSLPTVFPNALEVCDAVDNDCDGAVDNVSAPEGIPLWPDADGDGFGDASSDPVQGCDPRSGESLEATDCDDARDDVYPGALEACDGVDNDCDGLRDESKVRRFYLDFDQDGFGSSSQFEDACEAPEGYVGAPGDCNDSDPSVHPGAVEVCDEAGVDEDCDGVVGAPTYFAQDEDGDGYGNLLEQAAFCSTAEAAESSYVYEFTDCDDRDASIHPFALEVARDGVDQDCDAFDSDDSDVDGYCQGSSGSLPMADGYGTPCSLDPSRQDCDDANAAIWPGAHESCNGLDDDCDGQVDDGASDIFYRDADGDGFGTDSSTTVGCGIPPTGYVATGGDCDDEDEAIHPNALEVCDGLDNDCDGVSDEGVSHRYCLDADQDGHGDPGASVQGCQPPPSYSPACDDCDDTTEAAYPGAEELCNASDDDCDGLSDEGVTRVFCKDGDQDGEGTLTTTQVGCAPLEGFTPICGDCDDSDPEVSSLASETCNGQDDDCDGQVDEDAAALIYADLDGDGFGVAAQSLAACEAPAGWSPIPGDCNDSSSAISPAASEACNGLDDNCDGQVDEGLEVLPLYPDRDGDGQGDSSAEAVEGCVMTGSATEALDCDDSDPKTYSGAAEVCNDGRINDCTLEAIPADWAGCGVHGPFSVLARDLELVGSSIEDRAGFAVVLRPDEDGDGLPDLLIGAPEAEDRHGAVYVLTSSAVRARLGTSAPSLLADMAYAIYVGDYESRLGWSASPVGDVTGDSRVDFALGAPAATDENGVRTGAVYVVSGSATGRVDLSDGLYAARLVGPTSGASLGYSLSWRRPEDDLEPGFFLIGAPGDASEFTEGGRVYAIAGRLTSGGLSSSDDVAVASVASLILGASTSGSELGLSLAPLVDLEGDGLPDLLLGAPGALGGDIGAGYLFRGSEALFQSDHVVLPTEATARLEGDQYYDRTGSAVTAVGDFDGDGVSDIAVGADGNNTGRGAVTIFSGASSGQRLPGQAMGSVVVEKVSSTVEYRFGHSLASGGDLNGDGYDDLAVGVPGANLEGGLSQGAVYIFYGPLLGSRTLSQADAILSGLEFDDLGWSMAMAGDVNGDGFDDLWLGATQAEGTPGSIYLFLGGTY